ncbi:MULTISPECIES: hypothetical protein [Lysobacter]|uniref:hypothetical protein n=1 Tax=Lysobacter TaxID=68 RepID=UPI001F48A0F6|nr:MULTISPECIES: hypothetical protein [Lysobacter]UJB19195.1 hypothetical protein L1A79_23265 [Lysobacter capsici]UJQ27080.1 hypothetical protein L2D09_16620 [Lysobacter gummosus]
MPTVLIVGTSHEYQRRTSDGAINTINDFAEYLRQIIDANDVAAIAEEMSAAALEEHGLQNSVAQEICTRFGIPHALADPGPQEREHLGIQQRNEIAVAGFFGGLSPEEIEARVRRSYDTREEYWIAKLGELGAYPMVFICGADHVNSFRDKLLAQGHDAVVLTSNWIPRDTV